MEWIGFSGALLDDVEEQVNAVNRSADNREFVNSYLAQGEFDLAFECLVSEAATKGAHLSSDLIHRIEAEVSDADLDEFSDGFVDDLKALGVSIP